MCMCASFKTSVECSLSKTQTTLINMIVKKDSSINERMRCRGFIRVIREIRDSVVTKTLHIHIHLGIDKNANTQKFSMNLILPLQQNLQVFPPLTNSSLFSLHSLPYPQTNLLTPLRNNEKLILSHQQAQKSQNI